MVKIQKAFLVVLVAVLLMGTSVLVACGKNDSNDTSNPISISWTGLTANGAADTETTTALTLTFDKDPTTLSVDNISLAGAKKGELGGTGVTRTLDIYNISVNEGDDLTVTISNPNGFAISGSTKTVTVHINNQPAPNPFDPDSFDANATTEFGSQISEDTWFKFVCTESGTYGFYSYKNDNCDPFAMLFGPGMTYITYDDDNSGNSDFGVVADLEAGKTYYLLATTYDIMWNNHTDFDGGSYYVDVTFMGDLSGIKNFFGIAPDYFSINPQGSFPYWEWNDNNYYNEICQVLDESGFVCVGTNVGDSWDSPWTSVSTDYYGCYYVRAYDGTHEYEAYYLPAINDAVSLTTDDMQTVSQATWFKFDCQESGAYEFCSYGTSGDPYAYLVDSDGQCIDQNDDNGTNLNFSISADLEAGKTYYLYATTYNGFNGNNYSVNVANTSAIENLFGTKPDNFYYNGVDDITWSWDSGTFTDFEAYCGIIESKGYTSIISLSYDGDTTESAYFDVNKQGDVYSITYCDGTHYWHAAYMPSADNAVELSVPSQQEISQATWFSFTPGESETYMFTAASYDCNPQLILFDSDFTIIDYQPYIQVDLVKGETYYIFATTDRGFFGASYQFGVESYTQAKNFFGIETTDFECYSYQNYHWSFGDSSNSVGSTANQDNFDQINFYFTTNGYTRSEPINIGPAGSDYTDAYYNGDHYTVYFSDQSGTGNITEYDYTLN